MRKYFEYCLISALIAAAAATVMGVIVDRFFGTNASWSAIGSALMHML